MTTRGAVALAAIVGSAIATATLRSSPRGAVAILSYVTAIVRSEDGAVLFFWDVYGHDARLETALAKRGRRRRTDRQGRLE